ncbi:MAG TPA: metallophosphoesterase [Patescibacteria group bacterium]|nr:metallophosphoesterase [Patescibacteria group bacterium]
MNPIRFIHISDTHFGPEKDYELYGVKTYPYAVKIVEAINDLPFTPDFIIHTGDITQTHLEPKAYQLAASVFASLKAPVYYVTGNHDTSENILRYLPMGKRELLTESKTINSYRLDIQGVRFLTLDARGPDEIDPHGVLSDEQLRILTEEVSRGKQPLIIFIHFPALPLDSIWLDRDMLLFNGDDFHALLTRAKDRLCGVFFGHVHRGMQVYRDGILYSSAGSSFCQFYSYPFQEKPFDSDLPHQTGTGFFNIVTVTPEQTTVKEMWIR